MKHRILLILPAYNEEGKIGELVSKATQVAGVTVLVCADGCTDNTVAEAEDAGAIVSAYPVRKGIGHAIRRGIDYAHENGYELCCIQGGDNQDDPMEIPRLVHRLDKGYDLVIGSRYVRGGRSVNQNLFRFVTTKIYSLFFSVMTLHWINDASTGFRLFSTETAKGLDLWKDELNGYELEPCFLFDMLTKHRVSEVPATKYYHLDKSYSKMGAVDFMNIVLPVIRKRFGLL